MTLAIAATTGAKTIFVADKRAMFSSPLLGELGFRDDTEKIYKIGDRIGIINAGDGHVGAGAISLYVSQFAYRMRDKRIESLDKMVEEFNQFFKRLTDGTRFRGSFIIGGSLSLEKSEPELYSYAIPGESVKLTSHLGSVGCNDIISLIEAGKGNELLEWELVNNSHLHEDLQVVISIIKEKKYLNAESEDEAVKLLGRIIELTYDMQAEHLKQYGPQRGCTTPFISRTYDSLVVSCI